MTAPAFRSLDATAESRDAGARDSPRNCDPQVVTYPSRSMQSFSETGIPQRDFLAKASGFTRFIASNCSASRRVQAWVCARYTFLPAFEFADLSADSMTSCGFARPVRYCSRRSRMAEGISGLG